MLELRSSMLQESASSFGVGEEDQGAKFDDGRPRERHHRRTMLVHFFCETASWFLLFPLPGLFSNEGPMIASVFFLAC